MTLLAIETSCDETSVAVVRDGKILSNVVSSQIKLHAEYGGVVPELAAREHLRNLIPVAQAALERSGSFSRTSLTPSPPRKGRVCPTRCSSDSRPRKPSPSRCDKPFLGINHHEAHLYSPWISGNPPTADFSSFQPNVSLIVSGGHTMLVLVESELKHRVLGSTH